MLRLLTHLRHSPKLWLLVCATLTAACGSAESEAGNTTEPTEVIAACEEPSLALPDGSCIRPGIAPGGCAEGFQHDGEYGCDPILPEGDCAPGMMAVPGDTTCRKVMPCGEGRWGDLPVDATTQYVDRSYAGGNSDGSSARPWTIMRNAYIAAERGALIAVAAGVYAETPTLRSKPVRLWGVCPEKVSIVGEGSGAQTIVLGPGTDGTVIGGVTIKSSAIGVRITGAKNVTLDRVWIHETGGPGIVVQNNLGPTTANVVGSLIEAADSFGILVDDSDLNLVSSVVRNTQPRASDQIQGSGVTARMSCDETGCDETSRPHIVIEGSLLEDNHTYGVSLEGGDLTMTSTVVRDTRPQPSDMLHGRGIVVQAACNGAQVCFAQHPGRLTIAASVIENNHTVGLFVAAAEAQIDNTVVRGTKPRARDEVGGVGMILQTTCTAAGCNNAAPSKGSIRTSLFEANHGAGITISGSMGTIDQTVVRGTLPQQSDLRLGLGIGAQPSCDHLLNCDVNAPSTLTVSGCLVEDNFDAGISVLVSTANLSSSVVRRTAPRQSNGTYGDGVVIASHEAPAMATLDTLRIEESARAGLASFGATVGLARTHIGCAAFQLVAQDFSSQAYSFDDQGDNRCGCPAGTAICKAVGANLAPPDSL